MRWLVGIVTAMAVLPGTAWADHGTVVPEPNALTPDGAAWLSSPWRGAQTAEGVAPAVLTHVVVQVGEGGAGGPVRFRVEWPGDPRGPQTSPWYDLRASDNALRVRSGGTPARRRPAPRRRRTARPATRRAGG